MSSALDIQIGGGHYISAYQPIELMENVRMYATCSFILKYIYRHKNKGKKQDLEKALHCCDLMDSLDGHWYHGSINSRQDNSVSKDEFEKFIKLNPQLDENQIRSIRAIANRDMVELKKSINDEIESIYT